MTRKELMQNYWSYYLMLEKKFVQTIEYVDLDSRNFLSFSNEYALLLQAVGAELDNFFKAYCSYALVDRKTISNYANYILSDYPNIINQKIEVKNRNIVLQPFMGWNVNQAAQSLFWWEAFCNIKHSRYANISDANLKNVLNILSALYLMEMKQLSKVAENEPDVPDKESEVFNIQGWSYKYISLNGGFAVVDG